MCAIVAAEIQEPHDGSNRSSFLHGGTSIRGSFEHFWRRYPQSALVGIAISPDLEIIFDTVKSSRKYPNLMHGLIALLSWDGLGKQTVQFEGLASEANGPDLKRFQEIYFTSGRRGKCI